MKSLSTDISIHHLVLTYYLSIFPYYGIFPSYGMPSALLTVSQLYCTLKFCFTWFTPLTKRSISMLVGMLDVAVGMKSSIF